MVREGAWPMTHMAGRRVRTAGSPTCVDVLRRAVVVVVRLAAVAVRLLPTQTAAEWSIPRDADEEVVGRGRRRAAAGSAAAQQWLPHYS